MTHESFELPETPNLALRREGSVLHVTFNRPRVRNAMNFAMVEELVAVFDAIADTSEIRVVVLRGAEGNFCAGGDIKDMAMARAAPVPGENGGPDDPMVLGNRKFGTMMSIIEAAPQAVVAVIEGAVMGGGFGLACVADVSLAKADASFRLPETSLGIPPAQIIAFIVRRVGLTQARRLAVTGGRLDGRQAQALGIVHEVYADDEGLELRAELGELEVHVLVVEDRLAKRLALARVVDGPLEHALDRAQGVGRAPQPLFLELQHLVDEAEALLADQVALRHAHVLEEDLGRVRGAHAELVELGRAVDALGVEWDHDQALGLVRRRTSPRA